MAESSMFWEGTTIGDATVAPYDSHTEFAQVMRAVSVTNSMPNLGCVFYGVLNALAPTVAGAVSPVNIDSGEALCHGTFYRNTASIAFAIPNSAASRYDRIVLRKDWAAQTVRLTRIAGIEGGGAPPLVQIVGTTWDIPIVTVRIQIAALTITTDDREIMSNAPYFPYRQGGSATDWTVWGFNNYPMPQPISMQCGFAQIQVGGTDITFQTPFKYPAFVFCQPFGSAGSHYNVIIPSLPAVDKFTALCFTDINDTGGYIFWVAIGTKV